MTAKAFRDALAKLGMTQGQAAELFHRSIKMINAYCRGREPVAPEIADLVAFYLYTKRKGPPPI